MRVITFQSKEVVDILLNEDVYFADVTKCREHNDYSEDIAQLGGYCPIWVFINIDMNNFDTLLERWRCEMSLEQHNGLSKFAMLELEIDESRVKTGLTHNSYKYACVIDRIEFKDLSAIYSVENTEHWYFKRITLKKCFNGRKPMITDSSIIPGEDTLEDWKRHK